MAPHEAAQLEVRSLRVQRHKNLTKQGGINSNVLPCQNDVVLETFMSIVDVELHAAHWGMAVMTTAVKRKCAYS